AAAAQEGERAGAGGLDRAAVDVDAHEVARRRRGLLVGGEGQVAVGRRPADAAGEGDVEAGDHLDVAVVGVPHGGADGDAAGGGGGVGAAATRPPAGAADVDPVQFGVGQAQGGAEHIGAAEVEGQPGGAVLKGDGAARLGRDGGRRADVHRIGGDRDIAAD